MSSKKNIFVFTLNTGQCNKKTVYIAEEWGLRYVHLR
jgi:hypothetical protein